MSEPADHDGMFTRREYLTLTVLVSIEDPINPFILPFMVEEAVSSTALAHPEWDMDETRTIADWKAQP